ncbi:MAG: PEP-CTERM sorting domain-containing protein [Armatimonadetes bacterium]|nr:PEP-CTERM sorting domain-containing protein [Armatimonadota bacterium]
MTRTLSLAVAVVLLVVLSVGAAAQQIYNYTLSAKALGIKEQNVGTSYQSALWNDGGNLSLSAVSKIGQPFLPNGQTGTIWLDDLGGGVQNLLRCGSQGISGGGPDGDEKLIFSFSKVPIVATSPTLLLNTYKPKDDDTEIVVTLADGSIVNVPVSSVEAAAKQVAGAKESYTIAFKDLKELAGKGPLSSFYVREWTGHILVNGITGVEQVPEPATMIGFGLGAFGLAYLRRRRQRKAS